MADDRPVEDPTEQLSRITKELADLKSTVLARVRYPTTGDIEGTFRKVAKTGTLFLQGQTPLRSDYPALWQWIQDQGLVGFGFTAGNGTTTFGLPDARDRVLIGAGGTVTVGALVGSNTWAATDLPLHGHSVSVNSVSDHNHSISADDGNHGGHFPVGQHLAAAGADLGLAANNDTSTGNSAHSHGGGTGNAGGHGHTVNQSNVGTSATADNRQACIGANVMIYT
jgi:microcystin-dependent protein